MDKKSICETCKNINCIGYSTRVSECFDYERMTNADRIRAMADEKLAELIGDNIDCEICKKVVFMVKECPRTNEKDCYGVWLDWLKQETEEGE